MILNAGNWDAGIDDLVIASFCGHVRSTRINLCIVGCWSVAEGDHRQSVVHLQKCRDVPFRLGVG